MRQDPANEELRIRSARFTVPFYALPEISEVLKIDDGSGEALKCTYAIHTPKFSENVRRCVPGIRSIARDRSGS